MSDFSSMSTARLHEEIRRREETIRIYQQANDEAEAAGKNMENGPFEGNYRVMGRCEDEIREIMEELDRR